LNPTTLQFEADVHLKLKVYFRCKIFFLGVRGSEALGVRVREI
jgi:hypothetical protein